MIRLFIRLVSVLGAALIVAGVGFPAEQVKVIPAFPGAEGFGACTPGGRGGKVFEVTSLNDSGPGSLREPVEAEGPRIVVFRVSGNIELKAALTIRNPYVTIAGQTAPGDGICVKNCETSVSTHDVIVRYLRFRPGDPSKRALDALSGGGCRNVIIDHCSASWSIDECVSFYKSENVTIQWCLISESLYQSYHSKGHHGFGGIWGGTNVSFHHNLFAHHSSRNPRFASGDQKIDYRNNVIYNWGYNSAYGGEDATVNMIANYYKSGPATRRNVKSRIVEPYTDTGKWFIADNYVVGYPAITADNWNGGVQGKHAKAPIRVNEPFPSAPLRMQTAEEAYPLVLEDVGANFPKRDALDSRIIHEVRTGTAKYGGEWGSNKGIIDSQTAVGGWPALKSAPAPVDSDHDGMPDHWERAKGLNPNDNSDGAKDRDGDGYTNIEEYVNGLIAATP